MPAFVTLIAGPTASGKSARAIRLAKDFDARIINADSMQVYADLSILSARPTVEEQNGIPHKLFGFVSAREEYSVGRWLTDIAPIIAEARASGHPLIVVGGTGLYFRALTEGLMPTPAIPLEIRTHWRAQADAGHDLHAELRQRDPERAERLHPADTPRLLRAIELHAATGRCYSDWMAENPGEPLLAPDEWRGEFINPPRDILVARIDRRFDAMLAAGAIDEIKQLLTMKPALTPNLGVMKAHGAPHLAAHLRGELSLAEAAARGQQDTRAYARRQMVFARKYLSGENWRWITDASEQ